MLATFWQIVTTWYRFEEIAPRVCEESMMVGVEDAEIMGDSGHCPATPGSLFYGSN